MLTNLLDLSEREVDDAAVPRGDIIAFTDAGVRSASFARLTSINPITVAKV